MRTLLFAICLSLVIHTAVVAQVASGPLDFRSRQIQTMGTSPTALTAMADGATHDRGEAADPPQVQITNGVLTAGVYAHAITCCVRRFRSRPSGTYSGIVRLLRLLAISSWQPTTFGPSPWKFPEVRDENLAG